MSGSVVFLLIGALILAVVLVLYITVVRKDAPALNQAKYQAQWLAIENSLSRSNPGSYHLAILNADKLLDLALKERRFKGEKMADRMRAAKGTWRNENHVWGAHKIRNQLAHETDANVTPETALRVLTAYKQGLEDLGAI